MPKPETLAWLQQSAALDGSATSQVLLEVLERLERLEAAVNELRAIAAELEGHGNA